MRLVTDTSSGARTVPETLTVLRQYARAVAAGDVEAMRPSASSDGLLSLVEITFALIGLHHPRRSTQPGVPARCEHDNKTWPCQTFRLIAGGLNAAVIGRDERASPNSYGPLPGPVEARGSSSESLELTRVWHVENR